MNNKEGAIVNTFIETMTEQANSARKSSVSGDGKCGHPPYRTENERIRNRIPGFDGKIRKIEAFAKKTGSRQTDLDITIIRWKKPSRSGRRIYGRTR